MQASGWREFRTCKGRVHTQGKENFVQLEQCVMYYVCIICALIIFLNFFKICLD